jgi:hypothetical protein
MQFLEFQLFKLINFYRFFNYKSNNFNKNLIINLKISY